MKIKPLAFNGVFLIETDPQQDARGSFARCFDADLFAAQGLQSSFEQHSLSSNITQGTLRGLHYQMEPHAETKLVRCIRGRIYDVVVDLRQSSPSFGKWLAVELSQDNHFALYVPANFAHGFITLADNTEIYYMIHGAYVPKASRTIRWNDPALAIEWPMQPTVISEQDKSAANFSMQPSSVKPTKGQDQ
jgi:dTDP-4-dehydrorhamnose 3,5-epimerase